MSKRSVIHMLIFGIVVSSAIGVAYFLGDIGFGKSYFEQVSIHFFDKLRLLIFIDITAISIGIICFFKRQK